MTTPLDNHEQMADLLPLYLIGRLEEASTRQVAAHLSCCARCRQECADWESIKGATRLAQLSKPLPSAQLMEAVWAKIDVSAVAAGNIERWSLGRNLHQFWLVFRSQIALIYKSIWVASALVCLFGLLLTLWMVLHTHTAAMEQSVGLLLVPFIVIAGASGCAFIYGVAIDPGFEWTLATPTSIRLLMLCRLAIVLGYNLLLGLLASFVVAAVSGTGLWGMVQLWLGPLLFLSSLCLTVSLFLGSACALICVAIVEVLQSILAAPSFHLYDLSLPSLRIEPASPMLLFGAVLLVAVAVFFVPRQPRPARL